MPRLSPHYVHKYYSVCGLFPGHFLCLPIHTFINCSPYTASRWQLWALEPSITVGAATTGSVLWSQAGQVGWPSAFQLHDIP